MAKKIIRTNLRQETQRHRYFKRFIATGLLVMLLTLLVRAGFFFAAIKGSTLGTRPSFVEAPTEVKKVNKDKTANHPIAIALMGLDNGALYYKDEPTARTDALMVMILDPKSKSSTLLSIPRDTLTMIDPVTKRFDKINAAYMDQKETSTLNALEMFLNIPIDHYLTVNMKAFLDGIDALGGVTLTPNLSFEQDGESFVAGQSTHADGKRAMEYVRMRESDPHGDVGRGLRQQEVIQAALKTFKSNGGFTDLSQVYKLGRTVEKNMVTDISLTDLASLLPAYKDCLNTINHIRFESYQDLNIGGTYYLYVTETERLEKSNHLRHLLGLPSSGRRMVYPHSLGTPKEDYSDIKEPITEPGLYNATLPSPTLPHQAQENRPSHDIKKGKIAHDYL